VLGDVFGKSQENREGGTGKNGEAKKTKGARVTETLQQMRSLPARNKDGLRWQGTSRVGLCEWGPGPKKTRRTDQSQVGGGTFLKQKHPLALLRKEGVRRATKPEPLILQKETQRQYQRPGRLEANKKIGRGGGGTGRGTKNRFQSEKKESSRHRI